MSGFPGLEFIQEDKRLVARVVAEPGRTPVSPENIRDALEQGGFRRWAINDAQIVALAGRYADPTATFELPLGEARDASYTTELREHDMQVWIDVIPAAGGNDLTVDAVLLALGELGVTFGIDTDAIAQACAAREPSRFQVAQGVLPVDGENTRFELLVPDARDRKPQLNGQGLIDFRDLGEIPSVTTGQPLMRRIPPTYGETGRSVRGEVRDPVAGKDESFAENLVGAATDANDANLLVATADGQPVRCGNGVNVEQVFRVGDVNVAVGHISFKGTVTINGDVHPGMKVRATGDIVVSGVVDGGFLDAAGDVRVAGGAIAKADIRAGGAVTLRFAESAKVIAGTTIAIEDTALQCELQANNQILVGSKSPRGRLAGGSAIAMMLIQAPIIGSPTGVVTQLTLGVNPALHAEYQALLKEVDKQRQEELQLDHLVKYLESHGDKEGMLSRARNSWQVALRNWGRLMAKRDELERQLAMIAQARIEVGVGIAGAVDVTLGKKVARLRKAFDKGCFAVEEERFVFIDANENRIQIV